MYNNLPRLRLVLRTAWITGLISSTFSTLVVVFGSHRIGRGIALSFMEVGTVLLRDKAVTREPEWYGVAAGIVVHQSADIFWAVVFWGLLAKFSWGLRPWALAALAIPWAIATVSIEYYLFLPVNQPLLTMQTPFWAAAGVHISSAAAYPAFYWIRNLVTGISEHVQFARRVAIVLVGALAVIAGVEIICEQGREPYLPLMAGQAGFDQQFMRSMVAHHEVGREMALMAADKSMTARLNTLARMMSAEQQAEIDALHRWWNSWFGGHMSSLRESERAKMPGMPSPEVLDTLRGLQGSAFERKFVDTMIFHHQGAIDMSNRADKEAADPRLRLLAHQIIHAQERQITHMQQLFVK